MKISHIMELVLVLLITVLCSILVFKLLYKLKSAVPWRVNCWFCNNNFWIKYLHRNSWTCPNCDQYNGFTKDGDYNKPIITTNEQTFSTPKVFQKSPPKNGLCKMCNINQQLKVAQLASFVPINEKKYDEEIDTYRAQLDKAYKLCSPCKRVLHMKLYKEKQTLLATKLLETRSTDKRNQHKDNQSQVLKSFINNTSMIIAGMLFIAVTLEFHKNIMKDKKLYTSVTNIKEIVSGLLERIACIIKMKTLMTFPSLENYLIDLDNVLFYNDRWPKLFTFNISKLDNIIILTQKTLGGFVCLLQIIGHIWNVNKQKYTILIDLLWSVFVLTAVAHHSTAIDPIIMSIIKLSSTLIVLLVYNKMKTKASTIIRSSGTPKGMKNLTNGTTYPLLDDEDTLSFGTDDDVSLSKFGLHNFSDSSTETISPLNSGLLNGKSFSSRCDSIWTKPKHNSTFCVNPVITKSPSCVSEAVTAKSSFNKYQNLVKDDSDSDLDESISSLRIGSPKKPMKSNSVFSLRKFNPTPTFATPTPLNRSRPLISPSKLGHSTSWVAGGYWGSEGDRQIFNVNGSRSSSQSSGFESQTSSMTQRNIFSQPPSREESICGEPMVIDNQVPSLNSFQSPQNFRSVNSPVFPQMQYNGHVHIPQPKFAQPNFISQSVFTQQQPHIPNSMFKTPGLIKLPQVNSFASH
ncbi:uncharacterized protein LOC113517226 [Galleria mellonella]|uniref:Uncharacterized protein LOC113517226 n=1 Tax=Galleria mellonella TaxID=7137 RepID=A0A6J1WQF0_GALME|nr:uncharacterized protein LOC113517226 [Galleria mellonella]